MAEFIEQAPHVIKYEGDAGKYIKHSMRFFWGIVPIE